jgi:phage terminase large subunit GpA-like protein
VFANDTVGRAYHVSSAAPPWEGLRDRAEAMSLPRGVIPAGFLLLTVGVDCQADRIEWQAVAYGPQMRRCVVDVGVIDHAVTDTEGQKRLGALLDRTWPDTFGNRREFDLMGVDANAYTQDVHAWHKKLGTRKGRVLLVRGRHGDNAPILERVKFERKPDGTTVRAQKKWYNVGVSVLKNSLYAHLKKDDPSEMGAVLFVRDLGDEYFQQLTSEVRKKVKTSVGEVYRWVLPSGARNEALDTHNYATACAIRLRWAVMPDDDWARMAERMEVPLEPQGDLFGGGIAPVPPAPAAAPQPGEAEPPDAEPKKTSGRPSWMERMAALNRST